MAEKPINTIAGQFDRKRLDALKATIKDQDRDSVVMFEGQELLVSFGGYLAQYVETQFASQGTHGL